MRTRGGLADPAHARSYQGTIGSPFRGRGMHGTQRSLLIAGVFSMAVATTHLAAVFAGPGAYAYLGAPRLGALEARGSWLPDLVTLGLTGVFAAFGWYALAGAGRLRRPPWLLTGLMVIG